MSATRLVKNRPSHPPRACAGFITDRALLAFGVVALLFITFWRLSGIRSSLVVYCAHDSVFAEEILRKFESETGIKVAVKYDTEATKSLGLVELLVAEKDQPRCDVFWNNELLGTADLAERGILEPYRGPGWERIPERWKDLEARWTGFAARLRVNILNPNRGRIAPTPGAVSSMLSDRTSDLSRTAMAKPLYGTTLTHYTVLWHTLGATELKAWHADARKRGLRVVNGNGVVKDLVVAGECDYGVADTDDYFAAKDAGASVFMTPVLLPDGSAICIPNTVAVVRGSSHSAAAHKLVDYLLSAETELALAKSRARQIPLGPVADEQLPPEVRELRGYAAKSASLKELLNDRRDCLGWLKSEYAQ